MKKSIAIVVLFLFFLTSCVAYHGNSAKKMPPGQAKKVYGTKSAKPFAPGQQKKR